MSVKSRYLAALTRNGTPATWVRGNVSLATQVFLNPAEPSPDLLAGLAGQDALTVYVGSVGALDVPQRQDKVTLLGKTYKVEAVSPATARGGALIAWQCDLKG